MIANMNTNNGKRLIAAILAMAMIVCAVAVVAMPSNVEAEEVTKPTADFTGDNVVEIDSTTDLAKVLGTAYSNGVLTVTEDLVLEITGTVGSSTTPAIKQVILGGGNLQITGSGTIYIANDAASGSTIVLGYQNAVLSITDGVTVDIDSKGAESFTINNGAVADITGAKTGFNTALVSVTDGANLVVRHTGSGNSTWYNADYNNGGETYLDVDNATVNFSNATSVQGVVLTATNNARIIIDEGRSSGIVLKAGSVLENSALSSSAAYAGILVKGDVTLTNSSVTAETSSETYSGIEFSVAGTGLGTDNNAPGFYLDAESTLSADTYGFCVEYNHTTSETSVEVTIEGSGAVSGIFNGMRNGVSVTSETYTVNGVTLKNVDSTAAGVTTTVGANGIVVDGTFKAGTTTITEGGMITVASGTALLPSNTDASKVYVVNGTATIEGTDSPAFATSATVATTEALNTAASAQNAKITIANGFLLTAPVTLASGVEVTVSNGNMTVTNTNTITATNATYIGGVSGNSDTAKMNLSGSFTIKAGSVDVKGNISGMIEEINDSVNISGTIDGNLTISGTGTVNFIDVTVNPNVDVTLSPSISYNTDGKFYLYGALVVPDNNTSSIKITVGSGDEFKAFSNATISPYITIVGTDSTSKIDLGEAMGTQYIRQDVTSNLVYSQTQTVIIEESIFIKKGATLTVLGQLIVNENVNVVIEDGGKLIVGNSAMATSTAKVTINGNIDIENGGKMDIQKADSVEISGKVTSDGTLSIDSNVTVVNGGSILVENGDNSIFTIDSDGKLTVDAGGIVEIRGQTDVANIVNKGTITLNGAILTGNVKISMAADDAVVDIKSFTSDSTGNRTLEITDSDLIFKDSKTPSDVVKVDGVKYTANNMIVNAVKYGGIKGLVITENVTSETKNKVTTYYNSFILSGSIAIADESTLATDEVKTMEVKISGPSIDVDESLTISKAVIVTLSSGNLNVDGTITATADGATIKADSGSDINVSGMIETKEKITDNINAFSYEGTLDGEPVYYYTTLNTAITNGQTNIEALGTTSVLESVDIPSGTQVKAGVGHEKITIGSSDARDVVVTVKDGGEFRSCIIDVMGTLTFDNKRNDRNNTITSDVYVEDDVSKSYTNIYTALNNAQSGETVTIYRTGSNVILDKDVTIKEGVTLDIPSGKGVTVNDNVTMTVDGTVKLSGNLVAQNIGFDPEKDNNSTIAVNGTFMAVGDIPYADDASTSTKGYYISGAYYNLVNTAGNWNYVTPVEDAAAVSNDVTDGEIDIKGTNQVGDVTFTGDEDQPVVITIEGKLTAGTITLVYASVVITNDANDYQFDGTIATSVGSIQFVNSNGFAVNSTVDSEGATVMSIFGAPAQVDSEGADAKVTIATGNVSVLNDEALINDLDVTGTEFEISSGATLTVDGANAKMNAKDLEVNGTLVAYDGGNVTAENVYVIGTFTISPADSDNGVQAGSATVTNAIRVGISDDFKTTTAAVLNAEKIGSWKNIYVSAESTVTEDLVKSKAFTQFYVEDALWFTVYANTTSDLKIDAPAVIPTENALLEKWTGKDVNGDDKTVNGGEEISIGVVERFDANINYDIYKITVFADPGITAVYIDGKLMTSGYFENPLGGSDNVTMAAGFQTYVSAGNHEITYKLGNYFSGEAKMTVNGESVTGNTFTTSGMPESNDTAVDYVIYLQGIEASAPETPSTPSSGSSDDGMGLTDYLLIVLVILIVVMAIMVAVRLMRS